LENAVNKGFDAHDALLVGAGAAIGGLGWGLKAVPIILGGLAGYAAGYLADSAHYSPKYAH